MENYSVILFESNNFAMWAKSALSDAGIVVKLINVPRHLSSDCGFCLKLASSDISSAEEIMKSEDIEYQEIVAVD